MEDLLRNNFTNHYGLPVCKEPNLSIQTNETYFEIEDATTKEIVLHVIVGGGIARFSNPNAFTVTIANYDKFLTSLPHSFQEGRRRCDIIVICNSCFILGELKDRNISSTMQRKSVRKEATKQLVESLTTLIAISQVSLLANEKNVKKCCYFNKQATSPPTVITAVTAFNRLSTTFTDGLQMSYPAIEEHSFEFWEYLEGHTLSLM